MDFFLHCWSMFHASQLPAYTACFRLPVKHSTGCSWGTFGGVEVFEPSRTLCSWRSSNHLLPLFQGWRGCMDLLSLVECYAILPEGVSVADSRSTTCSWILNQASCSWPRPVTWRGTCELGAIISRSSLLLCCFSILKWLENMDKQCFLQNPAF